MFRKVVTSVTVLMMAFLVNASGQQKTTSKEKSPVVVEQFDPSRNAEKDIQNALAIARQTNKRVMLDVGGLWCEWCRVLDRLFAENKELTKLRDENFVWVKVNISPENWNQNVLSRYAQDPKTGKVIIDAPTVIVLEHDGKLLYNGNWSSCQSDKGYDPEKVAGFLRKWARQKE
jgi:thioredoxin-related protein